MAVPTYSSEATTDFLRKLQAHGYQSWYVFDSDTDKSALWKAIAHGVRLHSEVKYPEIAHFLEKKWKLNVQKILSANQRLAYLGDQKELNADYWSSLGTAMTYILTDLFAGWKNHFLSDIEKGEIPPPSNKSLYSSIASKLNLCICWYEATVELGEVTHVFHPETKGEVALFVNVAQEQSRFYFLFHSRVNENLAVDFPFAMKVGVSGKPLIIGRNTMEVQEDPRDRAITLLLDALRVSASFAQSVSTHLSPSEVASFRELQDRLRAVDCFTTSRRLESFALPAPIPDLLNLRVVAEVPRPVHTIETCEYYREDTDFVEYHSHCFHKKCLSQYLGTIQPSFPEMPKCPFANCQHSLPDNALDINFSLKETYEKARSTMARYSAQYSLPLPLLCQCIKCGKRLHKQYFMTHGCLVCVGCAYLDYSSGRCHNCFAEFSSEEIDKIMVYYERTIGQRSQPNSGY